MYGGKRTRRRLRRNLREPRHLKPALRSFRRYLLFVVVPLLCCVGGLRDAGAETGQTLATPVQDVVLTFQPDGLTLPVFINNGRSEVRFRAEPDFGRRDVIRGSIPVGPARSDFVGFAWDRGRAEIYVDVNQNLDLTDDPGQPIAATYNVGIEQRFRDIHIVLKHRENGIPYHFNLGLMGEWWAQAEVTSGWAGRVTLGGNDYQVSIADNFDGVLGDGDRLEVVPADRIPAETEHERFEGPLVYFNTVSV